MLADRWLVGIRQIVLLFRGTFLNGLLRFAGFFFRHRSSHVLMELAIPIDGSLGANNASLHPTLPRYLTAPSRGTIGDRAIGYNETDYSGGPEYQELALALYVI